MSLETPTITMAGSRLTAKERQESALENYQSILTRSNGVLVNEISQVSEFIFNPDIQNSTFRETRDILVAASTQILVLDALQRMKAREIFDQNIPQRHRASADDVFEQWYGNLEHDKLFAPHAPDQALFRKISQYATSVMEGNGLAPDPDEIPTLTGLVSQLIDTRGISDLENALPHKQQASWRRLLDQNVTTGIAFAVGRHAKTFQYEPPVVDALGHLLHVLEIGKTRAIYKAHQRLQQAVQSVIFINPPEAVDVPVRAMSDEIARAYAIRAITKADQRIVIRNYEEEHGIDWFSRLSRFSMGTGGTILFLGMLLSACGGAVPPPPTGTPVPYHPEPSKESPATATPVPHYASGSQETNFGSFPGIPQGVGGVENSGGPNPFTPKFQEFMNTQGWGVVYAPSMSEINPFNTFSFETGSICYMPAPDHLVSLDPAALQEDLLPADQWGVAKFGIESDLSTQVATVASLSGFDPSRYDCVMGYALEGNPDGITPGLLYALVVDRTSHDIIARMKVGFAPDAALRYEQDDKGLHLFVDDVEVAWEILVDRYVSSTGEIMQWRPEFNSWFRSIVTNVNFHGGMNLLEQTDDPYGAPDMIAMQVFCKVGIHCPTLTHPNVPAGTRANFTGAFSQLLGERYAKDTYGTGPTADTWEEIRALMEQGQLSINFIGTDGKEYTFRPRPDAIYTVFVVNWDDLDVPGVFEFKDARRKLITGDADSNVRSVVASKIPVESLPPGEFVTMIVEGLGQVVVSPNQSFKFWKDNLLGIKPNFTNFITIATKGEHPHIIVSDGQ